MNELALHIEYLLLGTDCVVVPGMGAFVAQRSESTWSASEELFVPPVRVVRFCEHTTLGPDELLLSSMCSVYHINKEEASRRIADYVHAWRSQLEAEGTADFGSLGVFTLEEGRVSFCSCEAGTTTPDLYGLDTFQMAELPVEERMEEPRRIPITSFKADDKQITIRLNRRIANYAATIAASVVMFFLWSTTIDQTAPTEPAPVAQTASMMPTTPRPAVKVVAPKPAYSVVVSYGLREDRAEKMSAKFQRLGITDARVLKQSDKVYVVTGAFMTSDEAAVVRDSLNADGVVRGAFVIRLK